MIVLRPNRNYIYYIYRIHEKSPRLHYYNNTLGYYTLNSYKQKRLDFPLGS
jgi:hypothetical protein